MCHIDVYACITCSKQEPGRMDLCLHEGCIHLQEGLRKLTVTKMTREGSPMFMVNLLAMLEKEYLDMICDKCITEETYSGMDEFEE